MKGTYTASVFVRKLDFDLYFFPVGRLVRQELVRRLDNSGAEGPTIFRVTPLIAFDGYQIYGIRGPDAVRAGLSVRKARKSGGWI